MCAVQDSRRICRPGVHHAFLILHRVTHSCEAYQPNLLTQLLQRPRYASKIWVAFAPPLVTRSMHSRSLTTRPSSTYVATLTHRHLQSNAYSLALPPLTPSTLAPLRMKSGYSQVEPGPPAFTLQLPPSTTTVDPLTKLPASENR